jgi:protein Mpv17
MALFLSSMAYLEGASPKERLQKAYFPGMVKNCMVWPWVQAVNFKFVPLDLRVLVVNVVSLGWNCYLSFLNSGGGDVQTPEQKIKEKTQEGGELPPS